MRKRERIIRSAGFTLVELMAVVVLLGLLGGIVTVGVNSAIKKARTQAASTQIKALGQSATTFNLECGFFPSSLQDLVAEPSTGRRCKNWGGPYLDETEIPDDPWGNPYNYMSPGQRSPNFDLWSNGPDGEEGTSDDIVSWATNEEE